jgi:hypothetical protein
MLTVWPEQEAVNPMLSVSYGIELVEKQFGFAMPIMPRKNCSFCDVNSTPE